MAGKAPNASENLQEKLLGKPRLRHKMTTITEKRAPTPCIANTAAMSLPLLAAEDDSEVTVAARGYSPPTPAPNRNLQHAMCPYTVI
mmetsp:Transcript_13417/g.12977  ORF Transcript_13417/g.12977 Transcript_13417/m.12977 type:complete len:87 (-) Transcript_13417:618-878(-)